MFFDPRYFILVGPAILLAMWAQAKVKMTFSKFSKVGAASGMSGGEVARRILDRSGLSNVTVEPIEGELTDHYDPRDHVLRLSEPVYGGRSLAALGVAAHEAGHAIQDAKGYAPMKLRAAVVPVAGFGSNLGPILIIMGVVFGAGGALFGKALINAGLIFFTAAVAFQVVTLPVEYNASSRAMEHLTQGGFLRQDEYGPTRKVLSAAALTYLAAALAAVMQLIYFFLLSRGRDE